MARDQEPVSDDEIQQLTEETDAQRQEIRADLAEDLGGEPEDYDAGAHLAERAEEPVADGGCE